MSSQKSTKILKTACFGDFLLSHGYRLENVTQTADITFSFVLHSHKLADGTKKSYYVSFRTEPLYTLLHYYLAFIFIMPGVVLYFFLNVLTNFDIWV